MVRLFSLADDSSLGEFTLTDSPAAISARARPPLPLLFEGSKKKSDGGQGGGEGQPERSCSARRHRGEPTSVGEANPVRVQQIFDRESRGTS